MLNELSQQQGLDIARTVFQFCQGYFGDEDPELNKNPREYYRDGKRESIPGANLGGHEQRWDMFKFERNLEGSFTAEWWERGARVIKIDLRPDGYLTECTYYQQRLIPDNLLHRSMELNEQNRLAAMAEILGRPLPTAA